jgi:glyoxylase-like metal-dependent hydrolase (beta-lactamase superfamily II)
MKPGARSGCRRLSKSSLTIGGLDSPTKQWAASVTLVRGPINLVVDTGLPSDRELILSGLARNGVGPAQVRYVVCTCGQSDRIGNNNLFPNATFVVSYDVSNGDQYTFFPFEDGQPYVLDEYVQVLPTPGHTNRDVSLLVRTAEGVVAVTGDLFERSEDLENPDLWKAFSEFPELQVQSRQVILDLADSIVPGHGEMFRVPKSVNASGETTVRGRFDRQNHLLREHTHGRHDNSTSRETDA